LGAREPPNAVTYITRLYLIMMNAELNKPFESIESAHEFVALLEESIREAADDVRGHLREAEAARDERQVRALNLALYKLTQLAANMHKSRRALNDLRSIRRLLFTERDLDDVAESIEIARRATTSF
jgi:hypothetical protein